MTDDLIKYLILSLRDWQTQLEDIEVHYDEEINYTENKQSLLKEIRETESRLQRMEADSE